MHHYISTTFIWLLICKERQKGKCKILYCLVLLTTLYLASETVTSSEWLHRELNPSIYIIWINLSCSCHFLLSVRVIKLALQSSSLDLVLYGCSYFWDLKSFYEPNSNIFCTDGMWTEPVANRGVLSSEQLITHSGEMPLVGRWVRLQTEEPAKVLKRTEDRLGSRPKP